MDNQRVARELVVLARELIGKINQKDYKYYVVVNENFIESGWEYREDAQDQLGELPSKWKGKVYQRVGLKKLGLNPDNDTDWREKKKASEGRLAKEKRIDVLRRIVEEHQYEKIDGKVMDATTASMLIQVYNALKPELQKKFDKIPLMKLVDFGWSVVK